MKKYFLVLLLLPSLAFANASVDPTIDESKITSALHPKEMKWEFDGFFGRFDRA